MATVKKSRQTKETDIAMSLNLAGNGHVHVETGIGFFDHMLTALAFHADWDLTLTCQGDLHVDSHHTVEDVGIVLGQCLAEALADKSGIARYGCAHIPMDEALARCVLDVSGRPFLVFEASFAAPMVGHLDTELVQEFFRAFAMHSGITLHISLLYGTNAHHGIEAIFKAVAHALSEALQPRIGLLSTKGSLA